MQSGSTPKVQDHFSSIETPKVEDMQIQLEQLVQQGSLSPEQAQAILADPSAMNQITTDPGLKSAQMDALLGLQDISSSGGLTDMDQANLSRIKNQEDTAARGQREAILQNAQSRGLGGSGLELMSQMQNQQSAATRNSQRDMDVAGQAQERALQALMQGGSLAGQIQNQDFGQKAQIAQANDAISKFNTQNRQNVGLTNTAANNAAQAGNLNAKQSIADANVGLANSQQQYNKELLQKDFNNKMAKAGGQSNVSQQNASNQGRDSYAAADAQNKTTDRFLNSGGMLIASDERGKCEIEEIDPSDFLDSITGYKYKYKDKKHGEGKQMGVMAQDLEKSEAGSKLVVETPEGKAVDYSKSGPSIMASLANLNDRLRKMEEG